jgi:hypothetical protein
MTKIHFITFGGPSSNFHDAVIRLCEQARTFQIFDTITGYTEHDLVNDQVFWQKHGDFLLKNRRGLGYWIWKPYLIHKRLMEIDDNDILLYLDCGCELNLQGKPRLLELITLAKEKRILMTDTGHPELHYTKQDLIDFMGMKHHPMLCHNQAQACIVMMKKCDITMQLYEEYYRICHNYHLIDDTPSKNPNYLGFIEHRHDQSVFSLLVKKYNLFNHDIDPTYWQDTHGFLTDGMNVPIWCCRNKTGRSINPHPMVANHNTVLEIPTVTILGSCRQHSLKSKYNVTEIQESLTYPHYTKEITQTIQFCKGISRISPEDTKYCFRTGLLNKKELDYLDFKKSFDNTDIFVIEIASRISYEWGGVYMHHIATEEKYGFPDRESIVVRDLTDEEIEEDLIKIRELLYPKPFIVVSDIATRTTGKRYELVNLLNTLCQNLDIPFIDPWVYLQHEDQRRIFVKEHVLAHYTDYGHSLILEVYNNFINDVLSKEKTKCNDLYQVYFTDKQRVDKVTYHGLGDYIRGCLFLYEYSKTLGRELKINFSHHHLSKMISCRNHLTLDECKNTMYIFGREHRNSYDLRDIGKHSCIFTNKAYDYDLMDEHRKFIIEHCLTPRLCFNKKILETKRRLGLEDFQYNVIHYRSGDDALVYKTDTKSDISNVVSMITKNDKNEEGEDAKFLFLTDNKNMENLPFIKKYNLITTGLSKGHMGHFSPTEDDITNTMIEFFLMATSKKIYQISVYGWGSGFSDTVNKIYKVPIEQYTIS